ncbi:MAG: hypothetical protein U0935_20205 [Pirellulales bacterium]
MSRRSILPLTWEVPTIFRDRLGDQPGRQRAMFHEEHLLLVLHQPPQPDEAERRGRFFWRQPDGTWMSNDLGGGIGALVRHLSAFDEQLVAYDRLEEAATRSAEYFQVIDAVTPLARAVRHLHEVLQDARQHVPHDRELLNLRDRAYDLDRRADLLLSDARNGLEFALARRAEQQAEEAHRMSTSAHRLNMLASFFFPMVTLAAVLGTNLKHGWEDFSPPWPFVIMMGGGLLCGLLLQTFLRRK